MSEELLVPVSSNLAQRGNRGRLDGAVGHPVPAVLLPSSQPHQEVRVQGVGGGVERLPMALASCGGVLGELGVDARVGVRVGPVRRVIDVVRRRRFALVSKGVPRELVDDLPTMRLGLRGKHKHGYK